MKKFALKKTFLPMRCFLGATLPLHFVSPSFPPLLWLPMLPGALVDAFTYCRDAENGGDGCFDHVVVGRRGEEEGDVLTEASFVAVLHFEPMPYLCLKGEVCCLCV